MSAFRHGHGSPQLPDQLGITTSAAALCVTFASDAALPITFANAAGAGPTTASTMRVVVANDQTLPISAVSLPLPTGAATETTLAAASAKLPASLGIKTAAGSLSVVLASDGTLPLPTGAATETTLAAASAKLPASLGSKLSAASLSIVLASDSANLPVAVASSALPTGAATQTTLASVDTRITTTNTTLSSINTQLPAARGQTTKSGSMPVTIASDQGNVGVTASNLPTTVAVGAGTATASTFRAVIATDQSAIPVSQSGAFTVDVSTSLGKNGVALYRIDHATPVTTAAYTQITASTAGTINRLHIFDSSGSALYLATGAAASESNKIYIPPGGIDLVDLYIPAGTRLSVKAVDANTSSGQLLITAMS